MLQHPTQSSSTIMRHSLTNQQPGQVQQSQRCHRPLVQSEIGRRSRRPLERGTATALPKDLTGLYRDHSKADQCAPDQKSPMLTVHCQPYHTIITPHQYTPALSFLGSRAPLSIYRGRSQFSATPDNQNKSKGVAQQCTHLQGADKVGAVLPRSDSDCKVRRQAQDSSEVVLATGEVQHFSQQYKQAAAYATLAHILEAGGQEDRHRVDLPTRLQVLQRHVTTVPTTVTDREET